MVQGLSQNIHKQVKVVEQMKKIVWGTEQNTVDLNEKPWSPHKDGHLPSSHRKSENIQ